MGLDVYLYKFEDLETSKRIHEEYETGSEKIWAEIQQDKKYEELTEEQKNEARRRTDELEKELKVKENEGEQIEINSSKYPDHYFKIGYFRSSYNDGGFNHVVGDAIGIDLYNILNPNEEYEFKPDWDKAKVLTEEAIAKFAEYAKRGSYRVGQCYNPHNKVSSSEEALKIFLQEKERNTKSNPEWASDDYSNSNGEFFMKGFKINAVINGTDRVYLIYEADLSWYQQALEIVLETIEYVLSQPDKEKYVLHWSS